MIDRFKMIPIHKRRYSLPNTDRGSGEPQYHYDEILPSFYVPTSPDDRHVLLKLPDTIAIKLNMRSTWDKAEIHWKDGVTYAMAKDIAAAEKILYRANDAYLDAIIPKLKKKIITFVISADRIALDYSVLYLVDNKCGKYYTLESLDGNAVYHTKNMYSVGDVPAHIDHTPDAEEWFKNVKEKLDTLNRELHLMLLKPNYDDSGKLTGYGYFNADDLKTFIASNTLPFQANYKQLLQAKNP